MPPPERTTATFLRAVMPSTYLILQRLKPDPRGAG